MPGCANPPRIALGSLIRSAGHRVQAFESPADFLSRHCHSSNGCLVLDVRLPGMSGLDLQRTLRSAGNAIPIIFITGHGNIPMTVRAMKGGAVEFLPKPVHDQKLLDAVDQALRSNQYSQRHTKELDVLRSRCAALTARERQVLAGILDGKRNKQVAAELGVSEITVKIHRRHVMSKMSAASLAGLVLMVARMSAAGLQPWIPSSESRRNENGEGIDETRERPIGEG
ncbi:response regulator transcription factor [Steroidobacter sp. S1-65]|uniref:Response regulator transcription factor n=1 Tax=Steroidobacter gossypii TaxID=2805490 RepID=A0ABS1WVN0_9GAMM|nr:response regulator transcription factor [Steroidobacter gossypii]